MRIAPKVLEIGEDDVQVYAEVGSEVQVNLCTDALVDVEVQDRYEAWSGTVALTIDWPTDDSDPVGSVVLTEVELDNSDLDAVRIESFEIADVTIVTAWGG